MRIQITFNEKEMAGFNGMVRTALDCAMKGGMKMEKSIDEQMAALSRAFNEGKFDMEFDSFLVVNFFEGVTEVLDRIGVWAAQTLEMAKDLAKIGKVYDKYMKEYLDSKEKEAE
jgi:predicted KAP-like P-loop ATPase